jgi:5-enolpyruvylshikimate-3-phosphate synthase
LSTPLRQLANAFGLAFSAKLNTASSGGDELAKRMRFMQSKLRDSQDQGLMYTIDVDFSAKPSDNSDGIGDKNGNDNALNIIVPGDEILASAFITLKCLVPKGDLEISNAPLQSWASQTASFIKKMNGKINAKENAKTAFGSCGTIIVQKSEYAGRKTRCAPLYQYVGQLPCMTVASAFAEGKSVFRELEALRLYEPDGLDQLEQSLRPLGARHGEMPDGIVIEGAKDFDGFDIPEPLPAHVAVAFCIAGLKCMGKTSIADDHVSARWPNFEKTVGEICEFRTKQ